MKEKVASAYIHHCMLRHAAAFFQWRLRYKRKQMGPNSIFLIEDAIDENLKLIESLNKRFSEKMKDYKLCHHGKLQS